MKQWLLRLLGQNQGKWTLLALRSGGLTLGLNLGTGLAVEYHMLEKALPHARFANPDPQFGQLLSITHVCTRLQNDMPLAECTVEWEAPGLSICCKKSAK